MEGLFMDKTEYKTIMSLLSEDKIDELKQYLEKRMNSKYSDNARKAIMSLINEDCIKDYPSYYQRTKLHQSVLKTYCGILQKLMMVLFYFIKVAICFNYMIKMF